MIPLKIKLSKKNRPSRNFKFSVSIITFLVWGCLLAASITLLVKNSDIGQYTYNYLYRISMSFVSDLIPKIGNFISNFINSLHIKGVTLDDINKIRVQIENQALISFKELLNYLKPYITVKLPEIIRIVAIVLIVINSIFTIFALMSVFNVSLHVIDWILAITSCFTIIGLPTGILMIIALEKERIDKLAAIEHQIIDDSTLEKKPKYFERELAKKNKYDSKKLKKQEAKNLKAKEKISKKLKKKETKNLKAKEKISKKEAKKETKLAKNKASKKASKNN